MSVDPNKPDNFVTDVNGDKNKNCKSNATCSICNKSYKNRYHLIRHERIHSGERP